MKRFDRDILGQSGVKTLILFEGTNDIGLSKDSEQIGLALNSESLNTNPVTKHFSTNVEASNYLKSLLTRGDAVVVKGSRGMKTEEIITSILDTE